MKYGLTKSQIIENIKVFCNQNVCYDRKRSQYHICSYNPTNNKK